MSTVHHCPRCALRFRFEAELTDHLVADHGQEPEGLGPDYRRAAEHHHHRHHSTPLPGRPTAAQPSAECCLPVILATDGGAPARTAQRLFAAVADPARVSVTVIGVTNPGSAARSAAQSAAGVGRAIVAARRAITRAVEDAVSRLSAEGFTCESVVVPGDPAGRIADLATRRSARLVVMGARPWQDVGIDRLTNRHAPGSVLTGTTADDGTPRADRRTSVSRRVLRDAGTPILAVRECAMRQPPDCLRVIVGYDGSPAADAAIEVLTDLFDPARLDVHLIQIHEPHRDVDVIRSNDGVRRVVVGTRVAVADEPTAHAVRQHLHDVQDLHAAATRLKAAGFNVRADVLEGHAEELLVHMVLEDPVDIVVVGSRGLGSLRRVLEGSVSNAMLRLAAATLVMRHSDAG